VKGVLDGADAEMARDHGVDGVIVSNHGGRQLDGAIAPMSVVSEIAARSKGMAVMIDGGFRRGTDVIKALALGADFVFLGRPFAYAAAVGGEEGVAHAIDLLRLEVDRDLAMLGMTSVEQIDSRCIRHAEGPQSPSTTRGAVASRLSQR
jgi:L-lactate dehydrogenase (cytochrome)